MMCLTTFSEETFYFKKSKLEEFKKVMKIDLDELIPGSKYFRWKEFLVCPKWGVCVFPTDIQFLNIIRFMPQVDKVRDYIDQPLVVTSGLRPPNYNRWKKPYGVGGALMSAHKLGRAIDLVCKKIPSKKLRELLVPVLDDFDLRLENLETPHIHLDNNEPGPSGRYFTP